MSDVLKRAIRLALVGLVFGLAGPYALGRFLGSIMPRLAGPDPTALAAVSLLLYPFGLIRPELVIDLELVERLRLGLVLWERACSRLRVCGVASKLAPSKSPDGFCLQCPGACSGDLYSSSH